MTYNQEAFTRSLPVGRLPDNNSFHSIDLSAATDRMPIALQKRVVQAMLRDQQKTDA